MMQNKNYISVTGGVSVQEVKDIVNCFDSAGITLDSTHLPVIGFLVSEKSLRGEVPRSRRFPHFNMLPEIISAAESKIVPAIHYNPRNMDGLAGQVITVFSELYESGLCSMVQLNTEWPALHELNEMKMEMPDLYIILQVSYRAMKGLSKAQIAEKVGWYGALLDACLIDPSRGRGVELDVDFSSSLYLEIKQRSVCSIGIAGGLCAENVGPKLALLKHKIGYEFNIDAEGRLREKRSDNYFGDDDLNLVNVKAYLEGAARILL